MECPKCKAKIGIMNATLMVDTGAVHCIKCYICGYWVQTGPWAGAANPSPYPSSGSLSPSQPRFDHCSG